MSARILVTGGRNYTDKATVRQALVEGVIWRARQLGKDSVRTKLIVVEGCARGADSLAEQVCQDAGWANEHHPADWDEFGKAAGVIRNQEMLDTGIDLVLAFHHDLRESRGTADMVQRALKARVPVWLST